MARRDLDKELEALRRLPGNKSCPSCSATAQFGFRDVCVKFATLVCSDCKAAHQARRHAARRAAQRASMSARVRPHDSRFRLSRLPCARGPSRQLTRRGFRRRRHDVFFWRNVAASRAVFKAPRALAGAVFAGAMAQICSRVSRPSHVFAAASFPERDSASISADSNVLMPSALHRWEYACGGSRGA